MSLDFHLEYEEDGNEINVFHRNITHNLTEMADKAGIYMVLWRPEETKAKKAKDIIVTLEDGLKKLRENKDYYEMFNSENGWGLYEHFVPFVEGVLEACKKYPSAKIKVSR